MHLIEKLNFFHKLPYGVNFINDFGKLFLFTIFHEKLDAFWAFGIWQTAHRFGKFSPNAVRWRLHAWQKKLVKSNPESILPNFDFFIFQIVVDELECL